MDPAAIPTYGGPTCWLVCFHTKFTTWWARYIPGGYKHVSAVAWVPETKTWVFFDPAFDRTRIWCASDDDTGKRVLGDWINDAVVIRYPAAAFGRGVAARFGYWCVPAVAHLLGVKTGAVTPRGLLLFLLRNGGEVVTDVQGSNFSAKRSTSGGAKSGK